MELLYYLEVNLLVVHWGWSNIKMYKYDWVWDKKKWWNPLLSKIQPNKVTENILIFKFKNFHPQMVERDKAKISW